MKEEEGWWGMKRRSVKRERERGWQMGTEGERTEDRKKKKRRFRAAAGIARLSVVKARSLCSILRASDDASACHPSATPTRRGVASAGDMEGRVQRGRIACVSRA